MQKLGALIFLGWCLSAGSVSAAICFLPDCGDKLEPFNGDANLNAQYCRDEGYIIYAGGKCPDYYKQDTCAYDSSYLKCDAAAWCTENLYMISSCVVPEYLDGQCPNGLPVYKECKRDPEKACKDLNPSFTNVCGSGWQLDPSNLCKYDPSYGICCNTCVGYVLASEIGDGYKKGTACSACGGITKYQKLEADCTGYVSCPSGAASGAATCTKGTQTLYSSCCAYSCSLAVCPAENTCTLEACSGKYCISGCAVNYIDYCTTPNTSCTALGYTAASCPEKKLTCPYDLTKFFCM